MTKEYQLSLAHINDTHSHFEPEKIHFTININNTNYQVHSRTGGYARIAAQLTKARHQASQKKQPFLFLHGGDSFEGTLYFREFKGAANADLLTQLKPDAMVLGNHEIDGGNKPVRAFLDKINFPILAGNMDLTHEQHPQCGLQDHPRLFDYDPKTKTAKTLVKSFYDTKIAIFGLTLDQMADIARPDPGTHFINAIETAKNTVELLHAKDIKHIILLSHLGINADRALANSVSGISLIVGAHSHTLQGQFSDLGLTNMPYAEMCNQTPILHAGKYAETIGLANIIFNEKGKVISVTGNNYFMLDKTFLVEADVSINDQIYKKIQSTLNNHSGILWDEEDQQIKKTIVHRYRPAILAMENQILTTLPYDLIHTRLPSKTLPHGSEVAPWVSRSMYQETKLLDKTIDFAIHNAGGVRQSLTAGKLTVADIFGKLLPFEIPLVTYQLQGIFLYQAIESAINMATNNSIIGTGTGSFPYTYGLRYFYDGAMPLGQRITKLEIMQHNIWMPVIPHQLYTGVSSAYTAAGKEGYHPLLNAQWQKEINSLTLPSAFVSFISKFNQWQQIIKPNVYYTSGKVFNAHAAQGV